MSDDVKDDETQDETLSELDRLLKDAVGMTREELEAMGVQVPDPDDFTAKLDAEAQRVQQIVTGLHQILTATSDTCMTAFSAAANVYVRMLVHVATDHNLPLEETHAKILQMAKLMQTTEGTGEHTVTH